VRQSLPAGVHLGELLRALNAKCAGLVPCAVVAANLSADFPSLLLNTTPSVKASAPAFAFGRSDQESRAIQ
jgi:hypothetical protein